jgi:hypothetical protein
MRGKGLSGIRIKLSVIKKQERKDLVRRKFEEYKF